MVVAFIVYNGTARHGPIEAEASLVTDDLPVRMLDSTRLELSPVVEEVSFLDLFTLVTVVMRIVALISWRDSGDQSTTDSFSEGGPSLIVRPAKG